MSVSFFDIATGFRSKLQAQKEQLHHYYRIEEDRLGSHYAMEREQFRASAARDIEGLRRYHRVDEKRIEQQGLIERENLRGSLAQGIESSKHSYRLIEQERGAGFEMQREQYRGNLAQQLEGIRHRFRQVEESSRQKHQTDLATQDRALRRWSEEFRGLVTKEVAMMRVDSARELQEREHYHQTVMYEIEIAEDRLNADISYARDLERTGQAQRFELFQRDQAALYELEVLRFTSLLEDRQAYIHQILEEFASRNKLGGQTLDGIIGMLTAGVLDNAKQNEMILGAFISKLAGGTAHRQKLEELEKRGELGLNSEIGKFIKDSGLS
jgi:hypothetical protein